VDLQSQILSRYMSVIVGDGDDRHDDKTSDQPEEPCLGILLILAFSI